MVSKSKEYFFVFCLAGHGTRFKEAGYETPKYLLNYPNNRSTIIEEIISSFGFTQDVRIKLICNKRDLSYKEVMDKSLSKTKRNYELLYIDDTRGQAETAFIAAKHIKLNEPKLYQTSPIIFFNGDTILKSRDLEALISLMDEGSKGIIDCFNSKKESYSYVAVDNMNFVTDIREKVVISNKATSGLYFFSSPSLYSKQYDEILEEDTLSEIYISDIYRNMIKNKIKLKAYIDNNQANTIILGTPDDYRSHISTYEH